MLFVPLRVLTQTHTQPMAHRRISHAIIFAQYPYLLRDLLVALRDDIAYSRRLLSVAFIAAHFINIVSGA